MQTSNKTLPLLTFFLIIISTTAESINEKKTTEELLKESRACNKALSRGRKTCQLEENCCYYESYQKDYEEHLPFCTSLDVFKEYYAKQKSKRSIRDYLRSIKLHTTFGSIKGNNFCEIIEADPGIELVKQCSCGSNFAKILRAVSFGSILVLFVNNFF